MKKIISILLIVVAITSCNEKSNKEETKQADVYASYGEKISADGAISKEEMRSKFNNLKDGDTITVKFNSSINEVCKKKGCWMKLDLAEDKESMVRFKDYGFFVPKDVDSKNVVVEGKAYVTKISVDQLRHYAKDGGKSEEEIAAIIEPEITYAFEANGVLIEQ